MGMPFGFQFAVAGFSVAFYDLKIPWPTKTTGEIIDMGFWVIAIAIVLGAATEINRGLANLSLNQRGMG